MAATVVRAQVSQARWGGLGREGADSGLVGFGEGAQALGAVEILGVVESGLEAGVVDVLWELGLGRRLGGTVSGRRGARGQVRRSGSPDR